MAQDEIRKWLKIAAMAPWTNQSKSVCLDKTAERVEARKGTCFIAYHRYSSFQRGRGCNISSLCLSLSQNNKELQTPGKCCLEISTSRPGYEAKVRFDGFLRIISFGFVTQSKLYHPLFSEKQRKIPPIINALELRKLIINNLLDITP